MIVFTHKKRLSLVEVTNHTDVAVIAEPLENITGGIKIFTCKCRWHQ